MENKNWDHLNLLSKKEIIDFLKNNFIFFAPTKGEVQFFKWQVTSDKLQKESKEYLEDNTGKKLAKEYDGLASKFNKITDINKKSAILKRMVKIGEELKKFHDKFYVILDKEKINDKLYVESQKRFNK